MAYNYRQHDAREKQGYIGSSVVRKTDNANSIRQLNRTDFRAHKRRRRKQKQLLMLGLGVAFVLIIIFGIRSIK